MKKILQIVDVKTWAIGTLAKGVMKYNQHFDWKELALHPKDLEQGKIDLTPVREAIEWADILDVQYWRTLSQLFEMIPELKNKPVILTHHNEKNLLSYPWPENVIHIAKTRYSETVLRETYPHAKIYYIPNSFDHEVFHYNEKYPPEEKMVGYVGRIVPWKNLKIVAQACYECGYPLMLMGKHDKPSYYAEIPEEHKANIRWDFFNCDDSDRPEFYKNITCYVGFSGGGREVGTLGFIEALASGVPVITTPAGLAADIGEDDENMIMVDYDDLDGLKEALTRVMESPAVQQRLRKNGWNTIRGYNDERMALQYREVFNDLLFKGDLVSVIIPTTPDRLEQTKKILDALKKSTYKTIEAIVVFDQSKLEDDNNREQLKADYPFPVKVLATSINGGYNLAMARNLGVIEADGKYLMFNDSRLLPDENAIAEMLNTIVNTPKEKVWVFGEKGGEKSTFVENFSMIRRQHFIDGGMSNERITDYGGMSQELRGRFGRQGFEFGYVPSAKAEQMSKGGVSGAKRDGIIKMKNLLDKLHLK